MASVPAAVRAGLTTSFTVSSDALALRLVANFAGTMITLDSVKVGLIHTFTFNFADHYTPGDYNYVIYSHTLTSRTEIESGKFKILPDLAGGDVRSQNKIILDAITAVMAGRATSAQKSVTVGDKSLSYYSWAELIQARDLFTELVAQEEDTHKQQFLARFRRV
jgi:hypothetical protein